MPGPMKLLVTRPQPDAERTARQLEALGIAPVIAPMLEAIAQDDPIPLTDQFSALAFTSINAVRFLMDRNPDPDLLRKPVYAVGRATGDAAREAGFVTTFEGQGTLAELATLIRQRHGSGAVFHPAGRDLSGDLAADLKPFGIDVRTATLYAMEPAQSLPPGVGQALADGEFAGALFFSRRTAEAFAALTSGPDFVVARTMLGCLCLSENCAEPLVEHHYLRIALADHPSHEAMMALALAFTRDQIRA